MGKNDDRKKMAEQPQEEANVLNQEPEQQPQLDAKSKTDEAVERMLKEKTEEAKLKFSAKVNLLVEDKELQEELHKVISDAVDEGISVGAAYEMYPKFTSEFTKSMEQFVDRAVNPTDARRADKYKQLYFNQRLAFSHLLSALQFVDAQAPVYEVGEQPFTSPYSRIMDKGIGSVLAGMSAVNGCMCERAL